MTDRTEAILGFLDTLNLTKQEAEAIVTELVRKFDVDCEQFIDVQAFIEANMDAFDEMRQPMRN